MRRHNSGPSSPGIIQSTIAVGSGGLAGKGWLNGTQSHLEFIPERHTDFIFAVFSEEFGLIGSLVMIALYVLLIWRALAIARAAAARDATFQAYVAFGLGIWIAIQATINLGVNMGVLPTKGLTLPLMSFGGSSLLANCLALAVLMRIDWENRQIMRGQPTTRLWPEPS